MPDIVRTSCSPEKCAESFREKREQGPSAGGQRKSLHRVTGIGAKTSASKESRHDLKGKRLPLQPSWDNVTGVGTPNRLSFINGVTRSRSNCKPSTSLRSRKGSVGVPSPKILDGVVLIPHRHRRPHGPWPPINRFGIVCPGRRFEAACHLRGRGYPTGAGA